MALDEALLLTAARPLLRVYRWRAPSVSFGYFEKSAPVLAAHPTREPVRRWTGGGVVLHGDDVTYSLIVPAGFSVGKNARDSYHAIHVCIAAWLRAAGHDATLADAAPPCVSRSCFENPVPHDILLAGHKIAGAAQRRTRQGLLHQGSILLADPPDLRTLPNTFAPVVCPVTPGINVQQTCQALVSQRYGTGNWSRRR